MSAKDRNSGAGSAKSNRAGKGKGQPAYETLIIGETEYVTTLTRKFIERKQWERPNDMEVRAFIPGTVRHILVKIGQKVEEGDPLLTIEAMKMLNEVASPVGGVVEEILVKADELVAKGALLIVFGKD